MGCAYKVRTPFLFHFITIELLFEMPTKDMGWLALSLQPDAFPRPSTTTQQTGPTGLFVTLENEHALVFEGGGCFPPPITAWLTTVASAAAATDDDSNNGRTNLTKTTRRGFAPPRRVFHLLSTMRRGFPLLVVFSLILMTHFNDEAAVCPSSSSFSTTRRGFPLVVVFFFHFPTMRRGFPLVVFVFNDEEGFAPPRCVLHSFQR